MSMTDPIADLLSRIRNAQIAKHDRLDVPASKLKPRATATSLCLPSVTIANEGR